VAQDLTYEAVVKVKNLSYRMVWDPRVEEYVRESIDLFGELEVDIMVQILRKRIIPDWVSLEAYPVTKAIYIPPDEEDRYPHSFVVHETLA